MKRDDLLLAVDIGNTHTVLAIYNGEDLLINWRLSTSITRTEDESWIAVKMLCESGQIPFERITDAVISSVVPDATPIFAHMVQSYLHFSPVIITKDLDLNIEIQYDDPSAVGADRICNAVGGFNKYGGPLIIVDFGTATTFDIVSEKGDYVGGVIAPGVETSAADLWKRAARLYKVELVFPPRIIGRNTEASMQSGIMYGAVEMVDGLVKRLLTELNNEYQLKKEIKVIATGGLSKVMLERASSIHAYDEHLTLDGMRIIFERVNRSKR